MGSINIVLADDHQMVREGLRSVLEQSEDLTVVAELGSGQEVLDYFEQSTADVVMMDLNMPELNGYEASLVLRREHPEVRIIALTMNDDQATISKMIEAGVKGYVLKSADISELATAVRMVHQGKTYFSSEVTLKLHQSAAPTSATGELINLSMSYHLTQRELQVLKLVAEGFSNTEIGEKLFISPRTVDTHRTNLMKKLNVKNMAGLIRFAIQNNLVE